MTPSSSQPLAAVLLADAAPARAPGLARPSPSGGDLRGVPPAEAAPLPSARAPAASGARQRVILGRLRERLFEVSRRNRLLHFRDTLGTLDLTQASVPLGVAADVVRADRLVAWGGLLELALARAEPVALNPLLDFAGQPDIPDLLERIRNDARRDAAEYGFEQLRLALCFLSWTDLEASPHERHDSPLLLLPVSLSRRKGLRDAWALQPRGAEAEVNPVVRHLLARRHGIELAARIDLTATGAAAFCAEVAARIEAAGAGVAVRTLDRPDVTLAQELARRRVERFRRAERPEFLRGVSMEGPEHAGPGGGGHAGVKGDRASAAAGDETGAGGTAIRIRRRAAHADPRAWDIDLCRVTLGNFKYRKMSLVRDYADLLATGPRNVPFDAVFSIAARPAEEAPPAPEPLEESFHVVPADPTQAVAIVLARTGASYVIQGPPGTGKSQTITNLVADHVMRGHRVLFVSEKRAALDVVHARLRQHGLDGLCCLIHDAQADRREFIRDLQATYEGLLAERAEGPGAWRARRAELLDAIRRELEPLELLEKALDGTPGAAGAPVRAVVARATELLDEAPLLSTVEHDGLPTHAEWVAAAVTIAALGPALERLGFGAGGVLARHPVRLISTAVVRHPEPERFLAARLVEARELLSSLTVALARSGMARVQGTTLQDILGLVAWADGLGWLASRNLLPLLDGRSEASALLAQARREIVAARATLDRAHERTRGWTRKLPADEVRAALTRAVALEGRFTSLFRPSWWRLRKALAIRYDLAQHAIPPRWTEVLATLEDEYAAAAALKDLDLSARARLGMEEPLHELAERLEVARASVERLPHALRARYEELLRSPRAAEAIAALSAARPLVVELREVLASFLVESDLDRSTLDELGATLAMLDSLHGGPGGLSAGLQILELLAKLPSRMEAALRRMPIGVRQLEAAVAVRCVDDVLRAERTLRLDGPARDHHLDRITALSRAWREANAGAVLERARETFLEHVRRSSLPPVELGPEERRVAAAWARGRRELEHELGKTMRHRSIRDLVGGESGPVVFDLKPVWLMSPLGVSDALPLRPDLFDVVIFDEASQIPLESAVPSLFRAGQAIVVGDTMQLPPTDFFAVRPDLLEREEEEETLVPGDDGRPLGYDLSARSFLDHAAKNLPSRMLSWHYRSRSESLVAFSNWAFYQGRLLTVPDDRLAGECREEIVVQDPARANANVERVLDRPLGFHFVETGIYEDRRNRAEAAYVARLVRGLLAKPERRSIGIVAFSEAQQAEIERALAALAREEAAFAEALEAEWEREEDGQFVGLLVKNLENVQGDERDVVILSVCYGRAPDGRMRMFLGPINQEGGERRLNVAFTRAKHHMVVVSSIRHGEITNVRNEGASCLASYLRFAEAASTGDAAGARRVLRELAVWRDLVLPPDRRAGPAIAQLAAALAARGFAVEAGIGLSRFRCDLAVRRQGERRHRLGILVDAESPGEDVLERDLVRPELLRGAGWRIARVLATDWYRDRDGVLERLVCALEEARPGESAGARRTGPAQGRGRASSVSTIEPTARSSRR